MNYAENYQANLCFLLIQREANKKIHSLYFPPKPTILFAHQLPHNYRNSKERRDPKPYLVKRKRKRNFPKADSLYTNYLQYIHPRICYNRYYLHITPVDHQKVIFTRLAVGFHYILFIDGIQIIHRLYIYYTYV